MISAWVLYYDGNEHRFEHRDGVDLTSTKPEDWSLPESCDVMLVLQNASFVGAWLYGERVKGA